METIKIGSRGDAVVALQKALGLTADGVFGEKTQEAVIRLQKAYGLDADGIVGPLTWAALEVPEIRRKSKRKITEIIVHCTATREGQHVTVKDIDAMHKQRGFDGIGYHYLVYLDGSVHEGRDVDRQGAHCTNHNRDSIGVCYVGGVEKDGKTPKDTRTPEQKAALTDLLTELKALYPGAKIHSHRDFANKACPSFDATKEYARL